MNVLCIHVDADSENAEDVLQNKFAAAFKEVSLLENAKACKVIVEIIPVHMSEAWMLADKELLLEEIGTSKNFEELQIVKHPEYYSDPKAVIEHAIRLAHQNLPKRRTRINIRDLYQPIGQNIAIEKLETLPSFRLFKHSVKEALKKLNYL